MFTVLHVETSNFFIKLFGRIIGNEGGRYVQVDSVAAAFEFLDREEVDLVITTVEVPGGVADFIGRLNKSPHKQVPVVVSTSTDSADERTKMFSLGVVDYIVKEETDTSLTPLIKKMIQSRNEMETLRDLRIAVLDDSVTVHEMMQKFFATYNIASVRYFYNAQELLALDNFDIYLVDINLPDMSGTQIVLEVRKRAPDAVVIAVSAVDHYKVISNILLAGADDYIIKPYNSVIMLARLRSNARMLFLYRELADTNRRLEELVVTDSLTGVYNHKHIIERLAEEVEKTSRYQRSLAVLMLDLDHFKVVNDTYGHQVGDQVLVAFADLVRETARNCDIVGRYGGEEFFVILPDSGLEGAVRFGNRLREKLLELRFEDWPELRVSVSGGVAEWTGGGHLLLIKQVDHLLYRAKENGRNRIEAK